jgi:hypothetical protein
LRIHHLALAGEPALSPRAELAELAASVTAEWQKVFA